jgi:hypothetical protein
MFRSRLRRSRVLEPAEVLYPVNTVAPTISGDPIEDGELTITSDGTWTNTPTSFEFQWFADNELVADETSSSIYPSSDLIGSTLICRVRGINAAGFSDAASNAIGPIVSLESVRPQLVTPSTVTGTVEVGQTLTATAPVWSDETSTASTWQLVDIDGNNGGDVGTPDSLTYVIQAGDLDAGLAIRFYYEATNSYGTTEARAAPNGQRPLLLNEDAFEITGYRVDVDGWYVGDTIGVDLSTWSGSPTFTYQWIDGNTDTPISGATSSTFTITRAYQPNGVYVEVTGTNAFGSSMYSASTGSGTIRTHPNAPSRLTDASITGTAEIGETITANPGTWTNSPTGYEYFFYTEVGNLTDGWVTSASLVIPAVHVDSSPVDGQTIYVDTRAYNSVGYSDNDDSNGFPQTAFGPLPTNEWTPAELTGKVLWYDASDASTITVATGVSEWQDKSGNARHLTQATTSKQPTWNSVDAISADGSNDLLESGAFDLAAAMTSNIAGIFVWVGRVSAGVVNLGLYEVGVAERLAFEGTNRVDWPNDSGGKLESWSATLSSSVYKICLVRKLAAGGLSVRLDGTQVASNSESNSFPTARDFKMYVGGAPYGDGFSADMDVKEILLTNQSDLTTAETIEGYLAWKHGLVSALPSDHPYKSAAPT